MAVSLLSHHNRSNPHQPECWVIPHCPVGESSVFPVPAPRPVRTDGAELGHLCRPAELSAGKHIVTGPGPSTFYFVTSQLVNFHANNCPALQDRDLAAALPVHLSASRVALQCLYIYEAPHLTLQSFNIILESCPNLRQFGNLSRWAVDCEGIQQIVRTIRNNNLELEILCGSHWFPSTCAKATHSGI